jgi:hypothetical protein
MLLPLDGRKKLASADLEKVKEALRTQGYYLQIPPPPENLLKQHLDSERYPRQSKWRIDSAICFPLAYALNDKVCYLTNRHVARIVIFRTCSMRYLGERHVPTS